MRLTAWIYFLSAIPLIKADTLVRFLSEGTDSSDADYACEAVDEDGNTVMVNNPCMCYNLRDRQPPLRSEARYEVQDVMSCQNGMAGDFPCRDMNLQSHVPLSVLNSASGSPGDECADIWGWTSDEGKEYALICTTSGVAFVDISDPASPAYLGKLPVHNNKSNWCDVKTFNDHAFIVTENSGQGLQVFNLNLLKDVTSPQVFVETAHSDLFGNAHNIAINEDSGFAYVVGANRCSGGLYMFDINNPLNPTLAGCFGNDGYTHDVQCVIYNGPDTTYTGKEICFASNEDTITIVDVTNKGAPVQISRTSYSGSRYTHQGWLTEDHKYFLFNDELDEVQRGVKTTTWVMNVENLANPELKGSHVHDTNAIDHNLYIKDGFVYEANYRAGLRVLELGDLEQAEMTEVAYFDVYATNDNASFNGAWSNYPFFASGNVIISSIEGGLFTVKQGDPVPTASPTVPQPTISPAPTPLCKSFEVVGSTDNYGVETDWKLYDPDNDIVLQADIPYGNNENFNKETCLESGDHTFKITDTYGDGMCCNYGEGFYRLIYEGAIIKEGGEYGSEEEFTFSVNTSPTSPTNPPNSPPTTSPPVTPPTSPPVTPPTSPPVTPPTSPPVACDIPVRLGLWSDDSDTIEYRLYDENGDLFENTNVAADSTYFEEACLVSGTSYTLQIIDPDGLCCNNGFGFATLNVNGNMKHLSKFTATIAVQFEATSGDISFSVASTM